ncbi:hypothetical protein [Methanobrevibacter gottschalkii]|nr:hypothetical protein [Methanobrevibacter gottschalkii]
MKIKAVKLFENGFMTQPFAFGGEKGAENLMHQLNIGQVFKIM